MGGWIGLLITASSTVIWFKFGWYWLGGLAASCAIIQFWSFGVMHNYAYEPIRRHMKAIDHLRVQGMPEEEVKLLESMQPLLDPQLAPNWITAVNICSTLIGVGLLLGGLVFWFR